MSALRRFVGFCRGYLRPLLLTVAVVTVVSLAVASKLSIDSNLNRLLPQSAPSVESLERLEKNYAGPIGRLTILFEGQDLEAMKEAADALAPKLRQLEDVERIEYLRPVAYFREYRFLYADYPDLQEVERRFHRRVLWEKKRANPFFVDVSGEPPPDIDVSDIVEKYDDSEGSDYYVGDEGTRLALFVFPAFPAEDLARAKSLTRSVRRTVETHLRVNGGDFDYGLTGRYKKRVDLQSLLTSDLATATLLAAGILSVFLILILRGVTGVAFVLVPLITGTIWTFAWAEIAFDSLNLLTGFLGAILLGLGVDYGLHLHFRYYENRRDHSSGEALARTLRSAGRANLFAGVTTMVPLATLLISDFQAFYEFGVISIGGLVFVLLSYAVMFPCLVFLFEGWEFSPREPASSVAVRRAAPRLLAAEKRRPNLPWGASIAALALFVCVAVPAVVGLPSLEFNRDFYVLQSTQARSWLLDEKVNELLGQSQTPAVVLTDSRTHSRRVVSELRRRKENAPGGYTIDQAVSIQSAIPRRQADKLEVLRELQDDLDDLPRRAKKEEEFAGYIDELDRVLAEAPIGVDELPASLRDPFERAPDSPGSVVLVFPAVDLTDMDHVEDFVGVLRRLPGVYYEKGYDAISESLLLYDIIRYVERDSTRQLALTLMGLLLISLLAFRRLRETAIQFAVLLTSIGVALGWIGLMGVDFNFLNVVILPIWLGLGVDATFHMLFDLREHPQDLSTNMTTTLAISAAFLTTMLGFGATLVAHHEGLYSLGEIAVWGLGLMLVVNVLFHVFRLGTNRAHRPEDAPEDDAQEE